MIIDCEQRTEEWALLRIGKVTGSRICDVLAEIKKGEAASRRNYRAEIIVETLTGITVDQYVSKEMQWGTDTEPFARTAYELQRDVVIDICGFALHPAIERFGVSPDGLIGDDGLVEIKCPNTATHIDYLLSGVVPTDYQPQMLAEMACTGRQWCDFVSFDPRLPHNLQLFVSRFPRDDARIAEIEVKVEKFLEQVDDTLSQLERIRGKELTMPCEVTICDDRGETLCCHPAITLCAECKIGMCSAHIVECDVCEIFLCGDCIISHRFQHDLAEQKLKARA